MNAIVDDLAPHGAMEIALAEQVAVKLWRLGRVVRFEADLIANAQAEDELLRAHEMIHYRGICTTGPKRTDIPTRNDVASARQAAEKAAKKLTERTEALGQLQGLSAMGDEDALPDWTLYEVLHEDFRPDKDAVEQLFKGESVSPFRARHARKIDPYLPERRGRAGAAPGRPGRGLGPEVGATREDAQNRQAAAPELGPPLRGGPGAAATRRAASPTRRTWTESNGMRPTSNVDSTGTSTASTSSRKPAERSRPEARRWPLPWSRQGRRPPRRAKWVRSAVFMLRPRR